MWGCLGVCLSHWMERARDEMEWEKKKKEEEEMKEGRKMVLMMI